MKYIGVVLLTVILFLAIAIGSVVFLTPALIRAEYWVGEMLTVKRQILGSYAGKHKIVVLSGSNTLFNVDTATLTQELGEPVINMGLHKAMPLDEVLTEGEAGIGAGDVVVLPLEPDYYCAGGLTEWQIRNDVSWDRRRWATLSLRAKADAASHAGPVLPFEILIARVQQSLFPRALETRRQTLNDAQVLAKFQHATSPTQFAYSAYHIDSLGNMRATESTGLYRGDGPDANLPTKVCPASVELLRDFSARMRQRGAKVFLATTPYMLTDHVDRAAVEKASEQFASDVKAIAPVLDSRASMLFERRFFFNTDLHLNSEGRKLRTRLLLDALRRSGAAAAR